MRDMTLDGVADTLYIPLAARVYVSKRFPEYFYDPKSLELESAIPGDGIQKGSNEYTMGKVGLYTKVAMAVTDHTGRASLLHMKL